MKLARLLCVALALAAPQAWGALGEGTWSCSAPANNAAFNGSSVTVDAGSNRVFLAIVQRGANAGYAITTFTVGGQTATGTDHQVYDNGEPLHNYAYVWNEAKIAAMSGSTVSFAASNDAILNVCYVTLTGVDQTGLASFAFLDEQTVIGSATVNVNGSLDTTKLIVVAAMGELQASTFNGWDGLTERGDQNTTAASSGVASGVGAAGRDVITVTMSASDDIGAASMVFSEVLTCSGTPSITSVDADDIFDAMDSSIPIVGTSLCTTHATATVILRDALSNDKTLTCSVFTDTSWTCAASGVGMGVVNGLKYGTLTLRFTNDAGNLGTKAVTVTVPSGTIFQDLVTVLPLQWDTNGIPNRIRGAPNDMENGGQFAARNGSGCTLSSALTLGDDGSFSAGSACDSADFDFTHNGVYIGTAASMPFTGVPVKMGPLPIANKAYTVNVAITPFDSSGYFEPGEAAISSYALKQLTTSTNRTLVNGAVTSSLLIAVDAVSGLSKDDYVSCDAGATNARIKYVDDLSLMVGLWDPLTCDDNAQLVERGVGNGSVTGLSLNSGSGVLNGTATSLGATGELLIRPTDADSLIGDSNPFSITIQDPTTGRRPRLDLGLGINQ